MEAKFKFEKLHIWQKAMDLGDEISEKFPKKEVYNLRSQICRASDSIALNISEGSILQSNPEQKKIHGLRNSLSCGSSNLFTQIQKKRLYF
jgi:four helix bundle protein